MFFKKDKVEGNDYHNLDLDNIPKHIAFIMDGNGRWAKKRKMPRTYGHAKHNFKPVLSLVFSIAVLMISCVS